MSKMVNNNFKVALITGATGYIGSQLAQYLVKKGIVVHIICRGHSRLENIRNIVEAIKIHRYDAIKVTMDEIIYQAMPDIVFHLASETGVDNSITRGNILTSNVNFGVELLDSMCKFGINKFINTSSYWQNYNQSEYSPVNFYAATKQAFQDILSYYSEVIGINIISLKLYEVYGPNDNRNKLVNLLKKTSISNEKLALSPGDQYLSMVHIDDVISCYLKAAHELCSNKMNCHEVYSVYSGDLIKLKDLVGLAEKVMNKKLNIEFGAKAYRSREIMIPSIGKCMNGWVPQISLESGLKKVLINEG